jgi:hypothetical protein
MRQFHFMSKGTHVSQGPVGFHNVDGLASAKGVVIAIRPRTLFRVVLNGFTVFIGEYPSSVKVMLIVPRHH